jgi:hypothetical protein
MHGLGVRPFLYSSLKLSKTIFLYSSLQSITLKGMFKKNRLDYAHYFDFNKTMISLVEMTNTILDKGFESLEKAFKFSRGVGKDVLEKLNNLSIFQSIRDTAKNTYSMLKTNFTRLLSSEALKNIKDKAIETGKNIKDKSFNFALNFYQLLEKVFKDTKGKIEEFFVKNQDYNSDEKIDNAAAITRRLTPKPLASTRKLGYKPLR